MAVGRRGFLEAGIGVGLALTTPRVLFARASRPLLLVLDVDTPGARAAYEDFKRVVERRFATMAAPPEVRFAVARVELTDENRRAIRQLITDARPTVVLAANPNLARMAGELSLPIPILFYAPMDPVAFGLTNSLTRPNKGMTGFTLGASANQKRREMLLRLYPKCKVMGLLSSKSHEGEGLNYGADGDRESLPGVQYVRFNVETLDELRQLMGSVAARRVDAWDVSYTYVPFLHPQETVRAIEKSRRPVIYPRMKHVRMGGMAAFEPKIEEADEVWAAQVASLLAGVPIQDIPVVQATRYSFGLNLKACRRVGIEPSKALLRIADLVLE